MARSLRFCDVSEGNYYHVTARGAGRRVLFDDDADRLKYLSLLFGLIGDTAGALIAWCLMDNHVHLIMRLEIHELSALIHRLHTTYAQYFNGRHGHVGPVFQGRYSSDPIRTDEHLMMAVIYVHRNPKDLGGGDWKTYPWSSYAGYISGGSRCETDTVLSLMGGVEGFKSMHDSRDELDIAYLDGYRKRLNDAEAVEILVRHLGEHYADVLASLRREDRNRELRSLFLAGLSIRQIERLSGIGRGIVGRAVRESPELLEARRVP